MATGGSASEWPCETVCIPTQARAHACVRCAMRGRCSVFVRARAARSSVDACFCVCVCRVFVSVPACFCVCARARVCVRACENVCVRVRRMSRTAMG